MSKENVAAQLSEEQRLAQAMGTVNDILTGKKLEGLHSAIAALDSRLGERLDALKQQHDQHTERTRKAEEQIRRDLDKLSAGLSGLQFELQGQLESTSKITGLLKNAATVFSGEATGPAQTRAKGQNVDSAVDNMFGDPDQAKRDMSPAQEPSKKS